MLLCRIEIIDYLNKFFISKKIPSVLIKYILDFTNIRKIQYVYYDFSSSCKLIVGNVKTNSFINVDSLLKLIFRSEKKNIDSFQCIILKNRKFISYKKLKWIPEIQMISPTRYSVDSLCSSYLNFKIPVQIHFQGGIPKNYYQIFIKDVRKETIYIVCKHTRIWELKRDFLTREGLLDDIHYCNNVYFSFSSKKLCSEKTLEYYKISKENTIYVNMNNIIYNRFH